MERRQVSGKEGSSSSGSLCTGATGGCANQAWQQHTGLAWLVASVLWCSSHPKRCGIVAAIRLLLLHPWPPTAALCCLFISHLLPAPKHAELLINARTPEQYTAAGEALSAVSAPLSAMAKLLAQPAADAAAARALLAQLVVHLRELDVAQGGGHTRAADVLALYAATQVRAGGSRRVQGGCS